MQTTTERRLAPLSGLIRSAQTDWGKFNKNDDLRKACENIFEKKFVYQKPQDDATIRWQLPPIDTLYSEFYQLESLQSLKERLNAVKSKLNDYNTEEWSKHTIRKDPAGEIPWRLKNETKAEFVTVAWCKFFECLHRFPIVNSPQLNSLHLCEAPGAFIAALNHYLYSRFPRHEVKWNWLSTTLNPYYEGNPLNKMIMDERFMLYTLENWLFHDDFSGNIINRRNIDSMQKQCETRFTGEVQLITADGSIDCGAVPDCQEEVVSTLQFAEIISALSILAAGGSFVLKMFTHFESTSVCKMFLLNCIFDKVHVFKPATSKRGNSEVYIVCVGYRKETKQLGTILEILKTKLESNTLDTLPLFSKSNLPKDFLLQHEICCRLFMNLQIEAIESNIYAYEIKSRNDVRRHHQLRTLVCNEFYRRYEVQPIAADLCILYKYQCVIEKRTKIYEKHGSYADRKSLKELTKEEEIFRLRSSLNELEKSLEFRHYGQLLAQHETPPANAKRIELRIYSGAPIKSLECSLYASIPVLLMRSTFIATFNVDPIWHVTAKCLLDESTEIYFQFNDGTDYYKMQQQFFIKIVDTIIEKQPNQLSFWNYLFLTHYANSLLRYLATNIFATISIANDPHCTVTLEGAQYTDETTAVLSVLRKHIETDERIQCFVDITELHRNNYAKAITEYNNHLLLKSFQLMLQF